MSAIVDAISAFADWLFDLFKDAFDAIVDLIEDRFVWLFDQFFGWLGDYLISFEAPDFLSVYSLGNIFANMHPMVGYFAMGLRIPEAFTILAAGVSFRMARKSFSFFF